MKTSCELTDIGCRRSLQCNLMGLTIACLPALAIAQTPGPPVGLYDIAVPTNCGGFGISQPLATPAYWGEPPPPVFAPNNASLYARTVNFYDVIDIFSSHPALIVPFSMKLPTGGEDYHRTEAKFAVQEPQSPVTVTLTGKSKQPKLGNSPKWKVRLYPRQTLQDFELEPARDIYPAGEQVKAIIKLPWTAGVSTIEGVFHAPRYSASGSLAPAEMTTVLNEGIWSSANEKLVSQPESSTEIVLNFAMPFPDGAGLNQVQDLRMQMTAEIQGPGANCSLTKDPKVQKILFKVRNPNYSPCPGNQISASTGITPGSGCSACLPANTPKVSGAGACELNTEIYAQGYCIPRCNGLRSLPAKPSLMDDPGKYPSMPGATMPEAGQPQPLDPGSLGQPLPADQTPPEQDNRRAPSRPPPR